MHVRIKRYAECLAAGSGRCVRGSGHSMSKSTDVAVSVGVRVCVNTKRWWAASKNPFVGAFNTSALRQSARWSTNVLK